MIENISMLNPQELIEWCKQRKKELNLSVAKLSKLSNVPEGTINRLLTEKNLEFRYSSIQPIVAVLIQRNEETPQPEENTEQAEYYYNTIEGYKLILENKDHIISELEKSYQKQQDIINGLKSDLSKKDTLIEELNSHIKWLQKQIDKMQK